MTEEELDKKQVIKDLKFMAKKLAIADNLIRSVYSRLNEIYEKVDTK